MLRAYQGYFNNGRYIPLDNLPIPEKKKVIITVLDDEFSNIMPEDKKISDISKRQLLAFKKYFRAIDAITDEGFTEEDFFELENNRIDLRRDLEI